MGSRPGTQTPSEVAERILRGVRENEPWILTHPEMKAPVETRVRSLLEAFDESASRKS